MCYYIPCYLSYYDLSAINKMLLHGLVDLDHMKLTCFSFLTKDFTHCPNVVFAVIHRFEASFVSLNLYFSTDAKDRSLMDC